MSDDDDPRRGRRIPLPELFFAFSWLGLSSFGGGVPAWMHRAFVERRSLLTDEEFAANVALARIVPGTNVLNLAVLVGYRARGAAGALAAGFGLLVAPTLVSIALVVLYDRVTGSVLVTTPLKGAAAGAAGLLIAMAVSFATRVFKTSKTEVEGRCLMLFALVVAATIFALVGVVQMRTVWTILYFSPVGVAFFCVRRFSSARRRHGRT